VRCLAAGLVHDSGYPCPMPWLRTIQPDEATGRLAGSYRAAIERAGRVFGIVKAQSLAPAIMDASLGLYQRIMYAEVGLTRVQRELLAVVVSRTNECHY
jgi:alkylhydroperoxidase family enzyme